MEDEVRAAKKDSSFEIIPYSCKDSIDDVTHSFVLTSSDGRIRKSLTSITLSSYDDSEETYLSDEFCELEIYSFDEECPVSFVKHQCESAKDQNPDSLTSSAATVKSMCQWIEEQKFDPQTQALRTTENASGLVEECKPHSRTNVVTTVKNWYQSLEEQKNDSRMKALRICETPCELIEGQNPASETTVVATVKNWYQSLEEENDDSQTQALRIFETPCELIEDRNPDSETTVLATIKNWYQSLEEKNDDSQTETLRIYETPGDLMEGKNSASEATVVATVKNWYQPPKEQNDDSQGQPQVGRPFKILHELTEEQNSASQTYVDKLVKYTLKSGNGQNSTIQNLPLENINNTSRTYQQNFDKVECLLTFVKEKCEFHESKKENLCNCYEAHNFISHKPIMNLYDNKKASNHVPNFSILSSNLFDRNMYQHLSGRTSNIHDSNQLPLGTSDTEMASSSNVIINSAVINTIDNTENTNISSEVRLFDNYGTRANVLQTNESNMKGYLSHKQSIVNQPLFSTDATSIFNKRPTRESHSSLPKSFSLDLPGSTGAHTEFKRLIPAASRRPHRPYNGRSNCSKDICKAVKCTLNICNWFQTSRMIRRAFEGAKTSFANFVHSFELEIQQVLGTKPPLNLKIIADSASASAIKEAFFETFRGQISVSSMHVQLDHIPVLPIGWAAGLKAAEDKILHARGSGLVEDRTVLVSTSSLLLQVVPNRWHLTTVIYLHDPKRRQSSHNFTLTTPVPNRYVTEAERHGGHPKGGSSVSVTLEQAINHVTGRQTKDALLFLSGCSSYAALKSAASVLAGMYKRSVRL